MYKLYFGVLGIAPFIKNQNYIKSDDKIEYFQPPQDEHGLYLLGKFPEDCVLKSVGAYGRISSTSRKDIGFLLFYIIKRTDSGSIKVRYKFNVRTPMDEVNEPSRLEHVKKKSFQNKDHPEKGDYLAVFIPREKVSEKGNNTIYPLGIVVKGRNASNPHQFSYWKNNISINYTALDLPTLDGRVKSIIEHASWSDDWQASEKGEALNINLKTIRE